MVDSFTGDGIIPAYAGSTPYIGRAPPRQSDHPRIRGEHPPGGFLPGVFLRIIPAYAGSTHHFTPRDKVAEDHPRIRGEHVEVLCWHQCYEGSSPHTRGALGFQWQIVGEAGIIPAYAGST